MDPSKDPNKKIWSGGGGGQPQDNDRQSGVAKAKGGVSNFDEKMTPYNNHHHSRNAAAASQKNAAGGQKNFLNPDLNNNNQASAKTTTPRMRTSSKVRPNMPPGSAKNGGSGPDSL